MPSLLLAPLEGSGLSSLGFRAIVSPVKQPHLFHGAMLCAVIPKTALKLPHAYHDDDVGRWPCQPFGIGGTGPPAASRVAEHLERDSARCDAGLPARTCKRAGNSSGATPALWMAARSGVSWQRSTTRIYVEVCCGSARRSSKPTATCPRGNRCCSALRSIVGECTVRWRVAPPDLRLTLNRAPTFENNRQFK